MTYWDKRFLPAAALCSVLAGCQSAPPDGDYVTFVREVMVESAMHKAEAGKGPEHAEQAEHAVAVWRSAAEDE